MDYKLKKNKEKLCHKALEVMHIVVDGMIPKIYRLERF